MTKRLAADGYEIMIIAMMGGRVVWGIVMTILLGVHGGAFTLDAFLAGAFLNAIPGIIVQLILIPAIMVALDKTKLVSFSKRTADTSAVKVSL